VPRDFVVAAETLVHVDLVDEKPRFLAGVEQDACGGEPDGLAVDDGDPDQVVRVVDEGIEAVGPQRGVEQGRRAGLEHARGSRLNSTSR